MRVAAAARLSVHHPPPIGNNILQQLTEKEYTDFIKMLEHAILSTDLSLYIQNRQKYFVSAVGGGVNLASIETPAPRPPRT